MNYYKVQSNRQKIKSLIDGFKDNIVKGEALISPRPEAGKSTLYYYAIVCVSQGSPNEEAVLSIKNKKELTKLDFQAEKNTIKFFWEVV